MDTEKIVKALGWASGSVLEPVTALGWALALELESALRKVAFHHG